jgi:hypothetical protein
VVAEDVNTEYKLLVCCDVLAKKIWNHNIRHFKLQKRVWNIRMTQEQKYAPEGSDMATWRTEAPPKITISYWKLGEEATVLDLMKAVQADEAEHCDVNHIVSGMKDGESNPFYDPD